MRPFLMSTTSARTDSVPKSNPIEYFAKGSLLRARATFAAFVAGRIMAGEGRDNGRAMPYDEDNEAYLDESEEIDDSDLDDRIDDDDDEAEKLPCPECGEPVYEQAERCPHCGSY